MRLPIHEVVNKQIKGLQFGALIFLIIFAVLMFAMISRYHIDTNKNIDFMAQLFEVEQLIFKTNLVLAKSEYKNVKSTQLEKIWDNVWAVENAIRRNRIKSDVHNLSKALGKLEVTQMRLLESQLFGFDSHLKHIFNKFVSPHAESIFSITTQLIEINKKYENTTNLAFSADLRGFFTLGHAHASIVRLDTNKRWWAEYDQAMQKFNKEMLNYDKAEKTAAEKALFDRLKTVVYKYQQNVRFAQLELFSDPDNNGYESMNTVATLSSDVERHLNILVVRFKQQQQQLEKSFFIGVGYYLIFMVFMGAVAFAFMYRWKRKLVNNIVFPLRAVVDKSKEVASGDINTSIDITSNISEIQNLIDTIIDVKQIVFTNRQFLEQQIQHQSLNDSLNGINLNHKDTSLFTKEVLPIICEHFQVLSAVLYLLPNFNELNPIIFATHNVSHKKLTGGDFLGDFAEQCFTSGKLQEINLTDHHLQFEGVVNSIAIDAEKLVVIPLKENDACIGVLEIIVGHEQHSDFNSLFEIVDRIAVMITSKMRQQQTRDLLATTKEQKEELNLAVEEMKIQQENLQRSEAELEVQAEELKATNLQLKDHNNEQERQANQLKKLNSQLEQTGAELRQANELKSQFLSKVSHELRTPLNSIIILLKTLLREEEHLSADNLKSLIVIDDSAHELLELINDLLDMARIEAGELTMKVSQVPLAGLIQRLCNQFKPIADQNKLTFQCDIDKNLPEYIETDPLRLQQVVRNFLSNAIKFTQKGTVTLDVKVHEEVVAFSVIDTGVGIDDANQSLIFEAFKQLDQNFVSSREGTGLGLSIAGQLATALRGRIELESTEGQGSCFKFIVPIKFNQNQHREKIVNNLNDLVEPRANKTLESRLIQDVQGFNEGHVDWLYLGADDLIWQELQQSLAGELNIKQIHYQKLSELDALNVQGLIVRADNNVGAKFKDIFDGYVENLNHYLKVICVVEEKVTPSYKWLEIAADATFKWGNAGKKQILNAVLPNKKGLLSDKANNTQAREVAQSHKFSGTENILVVDDDIKTLFSLGQLLKQNNLRADLADNIHLAYEKLDSQIYDCVITDLVLPDGTGIDLIKYIRETKNWNNLPIIVNSAQHIESERLACKEAGCDVYLDKPIQTEALLNAIEQQLGARNA